MKGVGKALKLPARKRNHKKIEKKGKELHNRIQYFTYCTFKLYCTESVLWLS